MATGHSVTPNFDLSSITNPETLKVAVLVAQWNSDITGPMKDGALSILKQAGLPDENVRLVDVPGSYELPVAAEWALSAGYDAAVCIGCLIKGDTPHFEFISESVAHGLMNLNLKHAKPVIFGVITTLTHAQAMERAGGKLGNKGAEAAEAALQMLQIKASF